MRPRTFWRIVLGGVCVLLLLYLLTGGGLVRLFLGRRRAPVGASSLRVLNFQSGETVRYPVVLLQGQAEGTSVVQVVNANSARRDNRYVAPLQRGRFKALTQLVPGVNRIALQTEQERLELTLRYVPMTTPYRVNLVYVLPAEAKEPDYADYREKLDTAAKLMQCFTAESLNRQGLGRRTFALEFDPQGNVVIHVRRTAWTKAQIAKVQHETPYDLYRHLYPKIVGEFPAERHQNLVFAAYSRHDFGVGDPGMALMDAANLDAWATRLADVANAETDSLAAWGLGLVGGVLHELGHTFGADHSNDPFSVMSEGCYLFNRAFTVAETDWRGANRGALAEYEEREVATWEPFIAAQFYHHRWFQPDRRAFQDENPIEITREGEAIVVRAPHGIGLTQLYNEGAGKADDYPPPTQREFTLYRRDFPKEQRFRRADLRTRLSAPKGALLRAMDREGNQVLVNERSL